MIKSKKLVQLMSTGKIELNSFFNFIIKFLKELLILNDKLFLILDHMLGHMFRYQL